MPYGFGGSVGAPLPPEPPGTPADRLLNALENLSKKVAPPLSGGTPYEKFEPVTLDTSGDTFFYTTNGNPVTMLTIQVFSGSVAICLYDGQGQPTPPIPYWSLGVIGVPVHIPLGTKDREVTVWATSNNTTLSFYLHSPAH